MNQELKDFLLDNTDKVWMSRGKIVYDSRFEKEFIVKGGNMKDLYLAIEEGIYDQQDSDDADWPEAIDWNMVLGAYNERIQSKN